MKKEGILASLYSEDMRSGLVIRKIVIRYPACLLYKAVSSKEKPKCSQWRNYSYNPPNIGGGRLEYNKSRYCNRSSGIIPGAKIHPFLHPSKFTEISAQPEWTSLSRSSQSLVKENLNWHPWNWDSSQMADYVKSWYVILTSVLPSIPFTRHSFAILQLRLEYDQGTRDFPSTTIVDIFLPLTEV